LDIEDDKDVRGVLEEEGEQEEGDNIWPNEEGEEEGNKVNTEGFWKDEEVEEEELEEDKEEIFVTTTLADVWEFEGIERREVAAIILEDLEEVELEGRGEPEVKEWLFEFEEDDDWGI
jgi:hypothetical protein